MTKIGTMGVAWVLAGSLLGLAGCADLDKMENDNYAHACKKLGIGKDSPDFNACMLQQQKISSEETQASMDRMQAQEDIDKQNKKLKKQQKKLDAEIANINAGY